MAPPAEPLAAGRLADHAPAGPYARDFAAGLLDPERPAPADVSGPRGAAAERRYAVYRNNVTASLAGALADIFPAVRNIVGEEFFVGMAVAFARAAPPRSRLLFEYGGGFAAFIETFEPARAMPYLADVARIERAWLDAFHAADAAPMRGEALAEIDPGRLAVSAFAAHPATRIVRSRYAALSIFRANRDGARRDGRIRGDLAEDTLITRPSGAVETRALAAGQADFLQALAVGAPLSAAVGRGFEVADEFDPSAALAVMIEAGAFSGIRDT